jgi:hypothetical protein
MPRPAECLLDGVVVVAALFQAWVEGGGALGEAPLDGGAGF